MKFIEQLDDNRFVVELNEHDIQSEQLRVVVAHDYVSFVGRDWHCTDLRIQGPHGISNVVHNRAVVQIPIRVAQDLLRTILKREYLKPKHLKHSDGTPAYLDEGIRGTYCYRTDEGVDMVAIEDPETGIFYHLPESLYRTKLQTK